MEGGITAGRRVEAAGIWAHDLTACYSFALDKGAPSPKAISLSIRSIGACVGAEPPNAYIRQAAMNLMIAIRFDEDVLPTC